MQPMQNPFLKMYDAWLEAWRISIDRSTELAADIVDPPTMKLKSSRGSVDTHKLLIEVECDEMTATKFFLGVITMAQAAEIYAASIDSLPPSLVAKALKELDFQFTEVDEDVPSVEEIEREELLKVGAPA